MEKYKLLILANILLRIPLLFIIPISMFGDGVERYIPYIFQILDLNFLFSEPPLFLMFWSGLTVFFSGEALYFVWKLVPFLFLIGSLFLLPSIYKIFKLKDREKTIVTALLLFVTPSLFYGEAMMIEMGILFLTLLLIILIEKAKITSMKEFLIIAFVSALMLYTKQTAYFIIAGFILFIFIRKDTKKSKLLNFLAIVLGGLLYLPWFLKNYFFSPVLFTSLSITELISNSLVNFFNTNFLATINAVYHFFWFIPQFSQIKAIGFTGIFALAYWAYYLSFLVLSLILSGLIVAGTVKFARQYKQYLFLMVPLFLFAFFWIFLLGLTSDIRYIFPFQIFFYFFAAKFLQGLKSKFVKKLFYLVIIGLVGLFLVTAYATALRMENKDDQIKEMANRIGGDEFRVISNDDAGLITLRFYSGKIIEYVDSVEGEIINPENKVFESKNYQLFFKKNIYYMHEK